MTTKRPATLPETLPGHMVARNRRKTQSLAWSVPILWQQNECLHCPCNLVSTIKLAIRLRYWRREPRPWSKSPGLEQEKSPVDIVLGWQSLPSKSGLVFNGQGVLREGQVLAAVILIMLIPSISAHTHCLSG